MSEGTHTGVQLPKQLQQASDDADKMLADSMKAKGQEVPAHLQNLSQAEEPVATPETPHEPVPVAPPAQEVHSSFQEGQPAEPAEPGPEDPKWKDRYNTLQGKYDAEIRALRNQVGDLQGQLMRQNAASQVEPEDLEDTDLGISDEDREEYGELLDVNQRIAKQEAQRHVEPVKQELAKIKEERFWMAMDREFPDWRELNEHEGFLNWLDQADPFTGVSRHALLQDAYAQVNAERAASFFKSYADLVTQAASPPKPSDALNEHVVPATRGPNAAPPAEPPKLSAAGYAKLQDDYVRGRYANNMDDYRRQLGMYEQAFREGRVTPA